MILATALLFAVAAVAAPIPEERAKPKARPTLVGKWMLMWVLDGETCCSGPAEFRADGTCTHVVDGKYTYNGTWSDRDGRLRVSETLVGEANQIDWWVDIPTGVGEDGKGRSVEIWMKP